MASAALKRAWKALAAVDDFELGEDIFGADGDPAYWVNATQVAHLHEDHGLELRLTRKVISAHRPRLKSDDRVDLRRSGSDWVLLTIEKPADVAFAVELAELVAAAHRPADGSPCKPPPVGADLARRKRFH